MSVNHWNRYLLNFIGSVCNINADKKVINSALILDVGIEDQILFYQRDKGKGHRGFIKLDKIQVEETGEEPAFKVPRPRSVDANPEEVDY
jgi:hypothetical protein